ncbi:sugar phosphate isomerase/epimerase family protein [Paenibacillus aceris]|uniref:Sugar phosphate isomerase/epimerase n=1 Tax=Paenibacillus aceris TaxID=869555 RepID=A0ABS4I1X2_9BACL|nr:sugar phosphate isomerase/epimerase [Paenibacillus aceris]MBP1964902.1 sugar phosphate isomerase/epimerase [Paenibacillus aceris]NHW38148.1 sugar phosphate isomerase/epimerase [Paenibacillus aceris]
MSHWNRINDGTVHPPRLHVQQAIWGMDKLGENGKEWSLEQKFEKIAEAGFEGVSYLLPSHENMDTWHRLLDRYKLSFSAIAFPAKPQDMIDIIQHANEFGRVQYINSQVSNSFVIDQEAIHLLDGLLKVSEESKIPHFIETHRGTVTQDLIRTVGYVEALPELRLMIDLSHYVVAGEILGTNENVEAHFDKILDRSAGIHGRVSSGEQIQVDVVDGDHPMLEHFTGWWRKGMVHWLKQAKPGDLFPFCSELGPPNYYGITRRDEHGQEHEVSDRWQQALLFKRIIEEQWKKAQDELLIVR